MAMIGLDDVGAALAALGALSTSAFGLLDASKGLWGGVSRVGLGPLSSALAPFQPALTAAMGERRWWDLVKANWMNAMPKTDQKVVVRSLIKLGLNVDTAPSLAAALKLEEATLVEVAKKLASGKALSEAELNLLGRLNAILDALLDSGFERADQQYKNVSRLWAGVIAVGLSLGAWAIWPTATITPQPSMWFAFGIGLLAVPVAPVAKDLTSALSAAAKALRLGKS